MALEGNVKDHKPRGSSVGMPFMDAFQPRDYRTLSARVGGNHDHFPVDSHYVSSSPPLTMSRRESRVSLNNRQHDALTEFENFKKKFLLANKHITKLNSTLSVRIEELQAQISALYVENLRLRASEIALAAQLKKEQEKSRKVLADAEAATSNLSKHFCFLRQSLNVVPTPSPKAEAKPPPKARRPVLDPNSSPQVPRLSRPPNIPGILEDEEVTSSPEGEDDYIPERVPSPTVRRKAKEKVSTSRLPVPTREASPPPLPTPLHVNLVERESSTKRKPSRRQSGLLSVNTDVGSSSRLERSDKLIPPRASSPAFGSPIRRDAGLAEDEEERQVDDMLSSGAGPTDNADFVVKARKERREKKAKQVERDVTPEDTDGSSSRARERKRRKEEDYSGLKDVTNSPRSRTLLPPLDTNTSDRDRQRTPDTDGATPSSAATSVATSRMFLTTPSTTPATTPQVSQLPTPRTSSPIPPGSILISESDTLAVGRERRARKSVNYAEPKLNTKMRKPDPVPPPAPPTIAATKKRPSMNTESDDPEPRSSVDGPSPSRVPTDHPGPKISSSSSASSSSGPSVKRKKSRPYVPVDDDDESDGTQADAEYGNPTGWINIDGRRRSIQNGNTHGSASLRRLEADDTRRHSLAV